MKSRLKTIITIVLVITRRLFNSLKKFQEYEFESPDDVPKFQYAHSSDEGLGQIRDTFNLDKINGETSSMEHIINVMGWAHQIVRWSSWADDISPQNAINIINVAGAEKKPVSCRMKATILNEAYLSLAYQSRLITCLPKTDDITGVHVVNMVYVPQSKKWIYMDPSFKAYFTDEKGNVLSFQEIRKRMIEKRGLLVNSDNAWPSPDAAYIAYIANNFVRFSCPIISGFDYETPGKDRDYVELVPKCLMNQENPIVRQSGDEFITRYFISNPDYFWVAPKVD